MVYPKQSLNTQAQPDPSQPIFRSGAVARMAGMPVSTLRIWEQRYKAVGPSTAPSGHRLYSAVDVERVALLRQLTGQGYAIGSLAGLAIEQLRDAALACAMPEAQASGDSAQRSAPLRIVVVGQGVARRLARPRVLKRLARPPQVVGVFDSLGAAAVAAVAAKTATGSTGTTGAGVDLLLWQASDLHVGVLPALKAAQDAWGARKVAVVYRFSGAAARDALASAGVLLIREPADDDAFGAWLLSSAPALIKATDGRSKVTGSTDIHAWLFGAMASFDGAAPARRFDDATLTDFAGLPSSVACECPSHLAELLMQISSFESYSAGCSSRNPADAELHAYLQRVAGVARILFETALKRVADEEGFALP